MVMVELDNSSSILHDFLKSHYFEVILTALNRAYLGGLLHINL